MQHFLVCVKYLSKYLQPANKSSESEKMILVLLVIWDEKQNKMPSFVVLSAIAILLSTLSLLPRELRADNISWVLWNGSVMATVIHTSICPGSLTTMMDYDCYTFKRFSHGYTVRVNIQFSHSTYWVEEEASVIYSAALIKV